MAPRTRASQGASPEGKNGLYRLNGAGGRGGETIRRKVELSYIGIFYFEAYKASPCLNIALLGRQSIGAQPTILSKVCQLTWLEEERELRDRHLLERLVRVSVLALSQPCRRMGFRSSSNWRWCWDYGLRDH